MKRREVRRVLWIALGVLIVGVLVAITGWIIWTALYQAGSLARSLAAAGWVITFALSWRTFRRTHGDKISPLAGTANGSAKRAQRLRVAWVYGVVAAVTVPLTDLSNSVQMVSLAVVTGFLWPAAYWIVRGYVKHPELREKLWAMPFNGSGVRTDSAQD